MKQKNSVLTGMRRAGCAPLSGGGPDRDAEKMAESPVVQIARAVKVRRWHT